MTWRDASGRTLDDFPRPSVAVDVALLTVREGRLAVLVHERTEEHATGRYSLPGTFVHLDETLEQAALRALRVKAGVTGRRPAQLSVFDDPDRDDRGRVLSVAHVDLVPLPRIAGAAGHPGLLLADVDGSRAVLPPGHAGLAFDHDAIVERAVAWARSRYQEQPDPRGLVADEFTLLDLQRAHEAVAGKRLQKDTFRRRMITQLVETDRMSTGSVGKPARLFRRGS